MSVQTVRINTSGAAQAGAVSRIRLVSQSVTGPAGADGAGVSVATQEAGAEKVAVTTVLDFLAGFDVAGAAGTASVALDLSEYAGAALPLANGGTGATDAAGARTALGLGTAATTAATDYATAAHNHTGVYEAVGVAAALVDDLSGVTDAATARTNLGLGTAATTAATAYATAAQGSTADTALQPAAIGATVQGYDADLADIAAIADAQGDIIVRGASGWERLAKSATSTDVLTAGASQPAWAAASGGGGSVPDTGSAVKAGGAVDWGLPGWAVTGWNTLGMGVDNIYYFPMYLLDAITVSAIGTYVSSAGTGTCRIGVYAAGTDWQPDALSADWGTITTTSTGLVSITGLSTTLAAGRHLIAFRPGATFTARCALGSSLGYANIIAQNYDQAYTSWTKGVAYADSLPDPGSDWPSTSATGGSIWKCPFYLKWT